MIHIYTGDGKGKTTAAVGLTLRAYGAGKRVIFFQFMKAWPSHEITMLERLGVIIDRSWDGKFIHKEPTIRQKEMVQNQYRRVFSSFQKPFDMIVLDEILVACSFHLLREEDILALMQEVPREKELVLTGRGATKRVMEAADLVTEMRKIKHYFDKGVLAREGIEF